MYNHQPKEYICPLCQIAKGEKTNVGDQEPTVIFRDTDITAFVAGKWWRQNPGHVIIFPNKHIKNIYDLPNELNCKIADFSMKVALALKKHMNVMESLADNTTSLLVIRTYGIIIYTYSLAMKGITYT
jgi:histidine triad (HIT) family protein